jgi:hypothetical protein
MQTLEKRTSESVLFDIDCSILLAPTETIGAIASITGTPSMASPLVFGAGVVNIAPVTYTDAFGSTRTAAIGKVIQVRISGGTITPPALVQECIVRAVFATNTNVAVEATARLNLNDTPPK